MGVLHAGASLLPPTLPRIRLPYSEWKYAFRWAASFPWGTFSETFRFCFRVFFCAVSYDELSGKEVYRTPQILDSEIVPPKIDSIGRSMLSFLSCSEERKVS